MHSPLTLHSYMRPTTPPQVPKIYNEAQKLRYFSIGLDVTRFIFHRVPQKRAA